MRRKDGIDRYKIHREKAEHCLDATRAARTWGSAERMLSHRRPCRNEACCSSTFTTWTSYNIGAVSRGDREIFVRLFKLYR